MATQEGTEQGTAATPILESLFFSRAFAGLLKCQKSRFGNHLEFLNVTLDELLNLTRNYFNIQYSYFSNSFDQSKSILIKLLYKL